MSANVTTDTPPKLEHLGDSFQHGIYTVYLIGDGIFQISDHELHQPEARLGGQGAAMYLVLGSERALLIDLGNNYQNGYAGDNVQARPQGAAEFLALLNWLIGDLPLDAAPTHMHVDHDGMAGALQQRAHVCFYASDRENISDIHLQHGIEPTIFSPFTAGQYQFDLGGNRQVSTHLVRGHTKGGTVFICRDSRTLFVFTGDVFVSGYRDRETLAEYSEDIQKLIHFLQTHFSAYERYSIRVYPAHAHMIGHESNLELAFHDWRYLQDINTLTQALLSGQWRKDRSHFLIEPWKPHHHPVSSHLQHLTTHESHQPDRHPHPHQNIPMINVRYGTAQVRIAQDQLDE